MIEFLSEEWFEEFAEAGSKLPVGNVSMIIQYEISGVEQGKLRFHMVIENSQINEISIGKHKSADCGVSTTISEAFKIFSGEKKVIEAFMQGDLKVDGDHRRYLLDFESVRNSEHWLDMCSQMVSAAPHK